MANSLENDWTVAELAAQAGVPCGRLRKIFPLHTGFSVYKYLQEARLHESKLLLESGRHIVTDVALATCYSSLGYFSNLYKRRFAVNPSIVRTSSAQKVIEE